PGHEIAADGVAVGGRRRARRALVPAGLAEPRGELGAPHGARELDYRLEVSLGGLPGERTPDEQGLELFRGSDPPRGAGERPVAGEECCRAARGGPPGRASGRVDEGRPPEPGTAPGRP